jgi:hypothetical protein
VVGATAVASRVEWERLDVQKAEDIDLRIK